MPKTLAGASQVKRAQPLSGAGVQRWLILIHHLPPTPTNLRVRTWRRLQEVGAIAVKQSVYVLPDTAESREDFEWLRVEIDGAGGDAVVFAADHVAIWRAAASGSPPSSAWISSAAPAAIVS